MKSFLAAFITLICVNAYAEDTVVTHPEITENPNVTLNLGTSSAGTLLTAVVNPADPSDVLFAFQNAKIDILFHKPSESGWFLQLLKQINGSSVKLLITSGGSLYKDGNETNIRKYKISIDTVQNLVISYNASDLKIIDPNAQPIVTIQSVVLDKMDKYADRIRTALENVGCWFDSESMNNHPKQ